VEGLSDHIDERSEIMFGPLKKVVRALHVPSAEERELQYLNAAGDRIDLEYRQRDVDRGMFRRGYGL
jgi:hypothetical protein